MEALENILQLAIIVIKYCIYNEYYSKNLSEICVYLRMLTASQSPHEIRYDGLTQTEEHMAIQFLLYFPRTWCNA